MILDANLLFSDAQALTATAPSTNVIDLGSDRDIGAGEPMAVMLTVDVAADHTTGNETYQVDIETDSDVAFGTAQIIATRVIAYSLLTAGAIIAIPLPLDNKRYLRLNYTLGGTTPTVTVTAVLIPLRFVDKQANYPNGFTVS